MKRREFVGTAAGVLIGSSVGSRAAAAAISPLGAAIADGGAAGLLADHLLKAYPAPASLAAIGDAFWQEADRGGAGRRVSLDEAVGDVLARLDLSGPMLRRIAPAELRARIMSRTAADFARGRIMHVDGWLLGETEARLCAMAALHTA